MIVIAHFPDIKAMFTLAIPDSFCATTKIIMAGVLFYSFGGAISLKWRVRYRIGVHTTTERIAFRSARYSVNTA